MTLIVLAVAWLLGILLADMLPHPAALPLAGTLLLALGALLARRAPRVRLAALALCCAALGAARYDAAQIPATPRTAWLLNDKGDITLIGVVAEDPQRTAEGQQLVLSAERAVVGGRERPAEGLVLVKLPPYPQRRYGERLALAGALTTPRGPDRPGAFDYRRYLERKGIFSLMEPEGVRQLEGTGGSPLLAALLELRARCQRVLLRELPEPQASLAVGILLGLQSSIPDDVAADFSATGTSHILVISGWNITIISTMLYGVTERLRLKKNAAFWAILVTIWLYTLFVGASATVIRAAVMGTVVVVGQRLERPAHAWTTLFAATWVMTLWNPQTLWDMGFQLSALATASLFAYGKGTEALLLKTPLRVGWLDWAREALTATLAAQILALPLILFAFGNLSVIAPLANVALLPMVPYAMLFGAICLAGGLVWLPLGQWLATVAYLFLAWLTEGARLFAHLPYAAVLLPPFPLWLLLGYYAIVVGAWLWNAALAGASSQSPGPRPVSSPSESRMRSFT
ncbi:MAG TPA: ComEC/Rec2 family competence protein [Roseiflexaceae bacterium]|nr:ComEC/Rec2 family competence protein [Roseiflexaceae bacterium]